MKNDETIGIFPHQKNFYCEKNDEIHQNLSFKDNAMNHGS